MEQPFKVVVEVVTPEVVSRLEADNQALRKEMDLILKKHEALHGTVYRLMETIANLKRNLNK